MNLAVREPLLVLVGCLALCDTASATAVLVSVDGMPACLSRRRIHRLGSWVPWTLIYVRVQLKIKPQITALRQIHRVRYLERNQ
jgi:hypothetical protein